MQFLTMEQVRRRILMKLASSDDRVQKLINLPKFKYATSHNENLSAISLENKIIKFNKPIYIDISKTKMYDYHYNVMQKHDGDKIELMYTDTCKFINKKHFLIQLIICRYYRFTGILRGTSRK